MKKWSWKRRIPLNRIDWAKIAREEPAFRELVYKATRTLYHAVAGKAEWFSVNLDIKKNVKKQEWKDICKNDRYVLFD